MAIDRNVTININDISPSANTAYVDAGKENKVYNKSQVNELIEDLREGTLGSILPSQTLPQLNTLPDGNYYAAEAGTYAFGVTVPNGWQYRFSKIGNVWDVLTKVEMPMQDLTPLQNRVANVESNVNDLYSGISGLEASVSNIDNRLDTLETKVVPNGDIYVGQLDRSVNGDRIEKYLMRNAIAGFKHSFADNYGYEKDSLVHADGRFWESKINENNQYPSDSSLNWEEIKFPSNADQEFSEDSTNSIANKKVTPLALSLKGFEVNEVREVLFEKVTSESSPIINGVSKFSNPNAWLTKINGTSASTSTTYIYRNIPTLLPNGNKIHKIKLNIVRTAANTANLLGIKSDNTIEVLIPNITTYTGVIEVFEFDVSSYKEFSFMLLHDSASGNNNQRFIEIYTKKLVKYDSVKEYIDNEIITVNSSISKLKNAENYKITSIDVNNNLSLDLSDIHDIFYVNKTTSAININIVNSKLIDTVNVFLDVTTKPIFTNTNIVWQNNEIPVFETGYSYFILLNTFNGGTSFIGSVIGVWETKNKILYLNSFDKENSLNYDIFNSPNQFTTNDVFDILNGELRLKEKVNKYPLFYFDTLTKANYTIEIEVHSNYINNIMACVNITEDNKTFDIFGFNGAVVGESQSLYYGYVLNDGNISSTRISANVADGYNVIKIIKNGTSLKCFINNILIKDYPDTTGTSRTKSGVCFKNIGLGVNSIKII